MGKTHSYDLNICETCNLPFNDYNDSGTCSNCSNEPRPKTLERLRIKLAWLVLYRAIVKGEDGATARRRLLEIAVKTRYEHKRKQFLAA